MDQISRILGISVEEVVRLGSGIPKGTRKKVLLDHDNPTPSFGRIAIDHATGIPRSATETRSEQQSATS